jgi:glycosyltransferase involved in cell wall biosynthesis
MTPRVSCIVPVHNGERYVAEAVTSVLRQTATVELVVVDDGSTDGTAEVLRGLGEPIRCVYQRNAGVSAARNHGLRLARGEWISFLDADDRLHPEKVARQLAMLRHAEPPVFVDCHTAWFWSPEVSDSELRRDPRWDAPFWKAVTHGHISGWLAHRSVFDDVGAFDEGMQFSEDTDWLLRLRDRGVVTRTLPDVLTFRRLHRDNITAGRRREQVGGLARALKASLDRRRGGSRS